MYQIEGTWEEVSTKAAKLDRKTHVRLVIVEDLEQGRMIYRGMFPQLANTPEEAFKEAEWDERHIEGF